MTDLDVLFVQDRLCSRARKEAEALNEAGVRLSLLEVGPPSPLQDYDLFEEHGSLGYPTDMRSLLLKGWPMRRDLGRYLEDVDVDVIHSHNEPDRFGALMPKLTDTPVVHDFHDLQTEILIPYASGPKRWVASRVEERWEGQAFHRADAVVATSPLTAEHLRRKHGEGRVFSVENRASKQHVGERPKLSEEDGEVHVAYGGGLSFLEEAERNIMPDLRVLADAGIHVHLYCVSATEEDAQRIQDACDAHPFLHNDGPVPQSEFIPALSQHDYGLLWFSRTGTNVHLTSPNRLYEYQVAGLPVVTNIPRGFTPEYVRRKGCGFVTDDIHEVVERVRQGGEYNLDPSDCFMEGEEILPVYEAVLEDRSS